MERLHPVSEAARGTVTYALHARARLNTTVSGQYTLGRRSENGRDSQSLPTCGSDSHGQRQTALGGVAGVGEQSEQDNGALHVYI